MAGGLFQTGGGAQQLLLGDIGGAQHVGDPGLALGDGAGLVQHHGVDAAHQLQTGGGFDEDALFGGLAGGHGDGHGGGQTQSAGAGDHQHGDADGQAEADAHAARSGPQQGGGDGDGDHRRYKHGADLVGQTADGRLGGGGLLHEPDDLGQGGVRTHAVGGHLQIAAGEDGGGHGLAAGGLFYRHALTGEGGLVHGAAALDHGAVHGDAAALPDDHRLTGLDLVGGHGDLRAAAAHHRHVRRQRQQRRDGSGGLALGALLQILAHGDERQDHAGGLEVQIRHAGDLSRSQQAHFNETVHKARGRTQRHQRVHVGRALEQAGEAHGEVGAVEDEDGHAQDQLHQRRRQGLAVHEGGHRQAHHVTHAEIEQGHQTHHGPQKPAAHGSGGRLLLSADVAFGLVRRSRAVARRLHCGNDGLRRDLVRIVGAHQCAQHQVYFPK